MEYHINDYIKDINKESLILPNFQREYIWDKNNVKKLIASMMFNLKIGAILTYKAEKGELPYLHFNSMKVYTDKTKETVEYVIDGQQRLTSFLIAFTNYFELTKMSPKYTRKYFLSLKKDTDLFGLANFEFKELEIGQDVDYDDFLEHIKTSDENKENGKEDHLVLIPLNNIKSYQFEKTIDSLINDKLVYLYEVEEKYNLDELPAVEEKAKEWKHDFIRYMESIFMKSIEKVVIDNNVLRAIKTYQIINRTGRRLDDLDILAAKYSTKSDEKRLYDVIREGLTKPLECKFIEDIDKKGLFSKTIDTFEGFDEEITWDFYRYMIDSNRSKDIPQRVSDQLIKLLQFTNLKSKDKYKVDEYKSAKNIALSGEHIKDNISSVLEAIQKAGAFLQIRCGLTSISKINYYWMLFVISALFIEKPTLSERDYDILTGWYFLSRFTGRYRVDQNVTALRDLDKLTSWIRSDEKYSELKMYLEMLKDENRRTQSGNVMVRKDILLCNNQDLEPQNIIGQFISEYCVRNGYESVILKNDKNDNKVPAFISTLTYPYTESNKYSLQIDHINPLDEGKTIAESEKTDDIRNNSGHKYNSPLNLAYLTAYENNQIKSRTYIQFRSLLSTDYKSSNCINFDEGDDFDKKISRRYDELYNKIYTELKEMLEF